MRLLKSLRALVPHDCSLYDIKETHSKLWCMDSQKISVTEMLAEKYSNRPHPELLCSSATDVGPATMFISYVWAYKVSELVDSIEYFMTQNEKQYPADTTYFWVDFLSVAQWGHHVFPTDYLADVFASAIANIGHTLVVLLPWHEPLAFTRSWCIWEVFSTIKTNTPLAVTWSPRQEESIREVMRTDASKLLGFLDGIRLEDSEAREEADKEMIDCAVQAEGGFSKVNAIVRERLRELIAAFLQRRFFSPEGVSIEVFRQLRKVAGPEWTVQDVSTRLILSTKQKTGGSFVDHLREHHSVEPHDILGITYREASSGLPPNVFVSFAYKQNFSEYVEALETYFSHYPGRAVDDVSFFSDLMTSQFTDSQMVSAGMSSFEAGSTGFRLSVEAYGARVRSTETYICLVLPWDAPVSFTRPWILYEFCVAMQAGLPVRLLTSSAEEARFLLAATTDFASVERAYRSCCRLLPFQGPASESQAFFHFASIIASAVGSLDAFGSFISARYLEWMTLTTERELIRQQRRHYLSSLCGQEGEVDGAAGRGMPSSDPGSHTLQRALSLLRGLAHQ